MLIMENWKKWILSLTVLTLIIIPIFYMIFVWAPQESKKQQSSYFEGYYLDIMENINSSETKSLVRTWFDRDFSFTELTHWVNYTLVFDETYNDPKRNETTDPASIKEIGTGRCGEFSILYVAACLAHGYDTRLVVATDISNPYMWNDLHVWAEVKMCGWIHIDPSGCNWGNKSQYEKGPWGEDIGSTVIIYAFEDGKCEEVTSKYLP